MRLDLLALLLVLAMGSFWLLRPRNPDQRGKRSGSSGRDLQSAAQRLGYALEGEDHPADRIGDPRIAAMGVTIAVAAMDGQITRDEAEQMLVEAQLTFQIDARDARDIFAVASWVMRRFETGDQAVAKLTRIVAELAGEDAAPDLMRMAAAAAEFSGPASSEAEAAIESIRQVFNVNV